jgi:hypothetical protein
MIRAAVTSLLCLVFLSAARGQSPLPKVEGADWASVREQSRQLLRGLRALDGALAPGIEKKFATLLDEPSKDGDRTLERLQELLDPLCLVAVSINPESRVKAARGPAPADLVRDRPTVVLLKIHNEAGITPELAVAGDELRTERPIRADGWLEAIVLSEKPFARRLSGNRLEYVALRLTARDTGKREATLKFDAGQGTQDLGFRAEVPILFRVRMGRP